MLLFASALLTASSITLLGHAPVRGSRALASIAAALAAFGVVKVHGLVEGLVVWLVLMMTVSSVLVLVLPPRPVFAGPLALTTGVLGLVSGVVGSVVR